jgi:ribonuclease Z
MTDLEGGAFFRYDGLSFEGLSLSGIRTAISMPDFGLSFDVAQGFPYTLRMKKFFITHGHLDHAAGIPYLISQKAMRHEAAPVFYMPPSLVEPLHEIMRLWEKIEMHEYQSVFHAIGPDSRIELNPQHFVRPFKTVHRIESFGYTLFSRTKKLKRDFVHLSGAEISELRKKGVDVNEWIETPLVSFTGDTQIEFLDQAPWVRKSKVLLCEATYLDGKKPVEHARKWGHTHLHELVPELDRIESERIVLIHSSSRYSEPEAQKLLREKIPPEHRERVVLFPGR